MSGISREKVRVIAAHQSGVVPLLLQISPSGHFGSGHLPESPNGGHAEHHFLRRRKTQTTVGFALLFCVFTIIKKSTRMDGHQKVDKETKSAS